MTYLYETLAKPHRQFRLTHSIHLRALKHHPETGEPIRRLIEGAPGFKVKQSKFDMTTAPELQRENERLL